MTDPGRKKPERRQLEFRFADVHFQITPSTILSPLVFALIGIACAVVASSDRTTAEYLKTGLIYGLLLYVSNALHTVGHVVAGKIVSAPNAVVRTTALVNVNMHRCEAGVCNMWTHIGRSLGGPAVQLLIAALTLGLPEVRNVSWLSFLGKANLIVGVWALLPIPTLDGWVVWGELFGFRRRTPV